METVILNQKGKETWKVELKESIFNVEYNEWLIHRALMYQLSNSRINVAFTKTRWERRGSTRKIYRQKGTGRARMWANRSPIRKKGWVVFWPRGDRNFKISMNRKERRKALFSLLSLKLKEKNLIIVDDIKLKEIKTKLANDVVVKLVWDEKTLLLFKEKNEILEKSFSNLPKVKTLLVNYINIADLLKYNKLVLLKDSLENINKLAVK